MPATKETNERPVNKFLVLYCVLARFSAGEKPTPVGPYQSDVGTIGRLEMGGGKRLVI